jgi:membrane associated rhomboid family serine protease
MPTLLKTPIAWLIFILTIFTSLMALFKKPKLYSQFIYQPWSVLREKKFYTLLTSGFIHADLSHLILNSIAYYFFAFTVARVVGPVQFAAIYLGSMVIADLPSLYKQRNNPDYYSLGASGAISGIIFSYVLFFPHSKIYLLLIPFGIPAPIFAIGFILISYYLSKRNRSRINHEAHLWGALAGMILTFLLNSQFFLYRLRELF